ncbi:MAG: DUF1120 domain-containing protein [Pseudomonas sp.]|jgi:hypothetical protein|uniref:Uncharacterized protein n=1 Tax=Pseudomonas gorinensis TaxID=3240790 RepID=A0ACA7P1F0_9PSED|nr:MULTISPECIES: DUF1120 domain-containing protein [Pseudomonas]AHC33790.1 hypothetical protein U771_06215 [Pseudomonas sp. TKP]MBL1308315.1 DUF1120 domain-containing protein [Pseudomonas sp.]WLI52432.1 DUF1120 domain-containing protein [Pseudomonas sp. FP833]SDY63622.1 Protein of unknown function [Pseudomonas sp. PDC86]
MFNRYLLLTTLLLNSLAQAASTVDLGVSGQLTPSACEPSLSNGGVYDVGKIAAKDLNAHQPTRLPPHSLKLAIDCQASTLLALEPRDNRQGSSYSGDQSHSFGLGLINDNQRLGALNLSLDSAVADGVEMYTLISSGPTTWAPSIILSPHALSAFTPIRNVTVPAPVQQLSALLSIQPIIAPTDTLLLTKEAPIDGSVTLTVKYL